MLYISYFFSTNDFKLTKHLLDNSKGKKIFERKLFVASDILMHSFVT